jgi:20S proteasome alpha/beta subunit
MTVLIGVLCRDGVVIGADSSVTVGITEQPFDQKIQVVEDCLVIATTGELGLGQRFIAAAQAAWQSISPTTPPIDIATAIAVAGLKNFLSIGLARIIHESETRPWDSLHHVLE